jgi:Flp pilus assembly pilin Flp
MKFSNRIRSDRRGAAVAEYGLIAAVAGVVLAVASLAFGSAVTSGYSAPVSCSEAGRC